LSSQREEVLDKRLAEMESIKADRTIVIESICERMGKIWESLGVEFLGSDTDMLDAQVANISKNAVSSNKDSYFLKMICRFKVEDVVCHAVQQQFRSFKEGRLCLVSQKLRCFHFLCVSLDCAQTISLQTLVNGCF
jgi:hypothetical protein